MTLEEDIQEKVYQINWDLSYNFAKSEGGWKKLQWEQTKLVKPQRQKWKWLIRGSGVGGCGSSQEVCSDTRPEK